MIELGEMRSRLHQSGGKAWTGWWPGTVVSRADPERRGRCRVRVPQVYGAITEDEFIADDELPWALPSQPTYNGAGEAWTPPPGAAVWVTFIGGDHESPIYHGGWPTADDAIPEHVSSYNGEGPTTRVIKTENGHLFEMRYFPGQERIQLRTAGGISVTLYDSPAEGGPRVEILTPGGRLFQLDDVQQLARIATPTQVVELLDLLQTINVTTPGSANVTAGLNVAVTAGGTLTAVAAGAATIAANGLTLTSTGAAPTVQTGGGTMTSSFTGAALYTFLGALTYVIGGILTITAATMSLTAGLITLTGTVVLGSLLGTKRRLCDERLFATLNDIINQVNASAAGTAIPNLTPGNVNPLYDTNQLATTNTTAD